MMGSKISVISRMGVLGCWLAGSLAVASAQSVSRIIFPIGLRGLRQRRWGRSWRSIF